LVTAAAALPAGAGEFGDLPAVPDIAALEALFAREGVEVSATQVPERF
jgi:hypothetical protein